MNEPTFGNVVYNWRRASFKARVKAVLALKGWSMEQLAQQMRVTRQYLHQAVKIRNGDTLSGKRLNDMSLALDVSLDELFFQPFGEPHDVDRDEPEWMDAPMGPFPKHLVDNPGDES